MKPFEVMVGTVAKMEEKLKEMNKAMKKNKVKLKVMNHQILLKMKKSQDLVMKLKMLSIMSLVSYLRI